MKQRRYDQVTKFSKRYRFLFKLTPVALVAGVLFSCSSNDLEEVLEFSEGQLLPVQTTRNVTYTYTDSGRVKNTLEAALMERFQQGDSTYSNLSGGFALTFYTANGNFDGRLTAKNGMISNNNGLMVARDSVVFVNRDGETLHTEELTWYQDSAKVFTDKFVTIERKEAVIYGKGLESNQNFTNYVINEVTGLINIDEDE